MRSSDTHQHPEPTGSGPGDLTLTRRQLLIYGSLTGAMALFAGCSRAPEQQAIPFLEQPEQTTPGISRWYSTTCGGCAAGCTVMARVLDGRPIKLEGAVSPLNPNGGLCVVGHAQIRGLYDADRFDGPRLAGESATWAALDQHVSTTLAELKQAGRPVALLTDRISGPAMRSVIARFVAAFPNVVHHEVDPGVPAAMAAAWKQATGADAVPDLRLDRARMILGVEADFLGAWWQPVSLAAGYADARHPERAGGSSRHVQIESRHSLTGGNADQRVVVAPSQMRAVLAQLLVRVGKAVGANLPLASAPPCEVPDATLADVTRQLVAARADAVVVCGVEDVPTQLLAGALNSLLGAIRPDGPLDTAHPVSLPVSSTDVVGELIDDATAGRLGGLIVLGHNPVHSHPRGADLAAALANVPLSVALDLRETETTAACHTVSPTPHFLECWGDGQPRNDLLTLSQPTVRPLRDCRSWAESLMRWSGDENPNMLAALKQHWRTNVAPVLSPAATGSGPAADLAFDRFWRACLKAGFVQLPAGNPLHAGFNTAVLPTSDTCAALADDADGLELLVYSSSISGTGRHIDNPWLQECPDPVTRLTWDNAALLHPATADRLGLANGQLVSVSDPADAARTLSLPAFRVPGMHRQVVAVARGYGRQRAGRFGRGVGANVAPLLGCRIVKLSPRSEHRQLGLLQDADAGRTTSPFTGGKRHIMPEATVAEYAHNAASGRLPGKQAAQPFTAHDYAGRKWAMVVDLSRCIGCSGCIVACQAENNIPVVGRDEVALHREMHWLRVDRYFIGDEDTTRTQHMPLMCQQCDNAPCEAVCPVLATTHGSEGLNEQTYNRCVGTRYCANNCPYKARRFNWFEYPHDSELENQVLNPHVTVRGRGVMEKCTFCVQRISAAKATARQEGCELADGDIQPACAQGCPTQAIVFGDGNDAASRVAAGQESPRAGRLLEEVNTRPAVNYLTRVRHADPGTEPGAGGEEPQHG